MAGTESVDAGVLEKSPDDRFHTDIVPQPRHARPEAAYAAHHAVDLHAGAARLVERVDDLGIDEGVALHPDGPRPTGLRVIDLVADVLEDALLQGDRRDGHPLELGRLGVAGDEIKDAGDIA